MKHLLTFISTVIGASALLPSAALYAQAPAAAPSATPSVSVPAGTTTAATATGGESESERSGRFRAALAALSPQERQELAAARLKAMSDPAVKAAAAERVSDRPAFRRIMIAAMLRADPNVGPILKKMRAAGEQ